MIVKLEDLLRRRSMISQVVRREELIAAPGLREACRILFGEQAEAKLEEYIAATIPDQEAKSPASLETAAVTS